MGSRTTFTRFSLLALSSLLNGFLSFVSIDGGDNCLVFLPACIETVSRAPRYYMEWRVYLVLATKKKKKVQSPLAGNCQFILRRRNDATRLHRDLYTFDCAARGCPIRDFEKFLVKAWDFLSFFSFKDRIGNMIKVENCFRISFKMQRRWRGRNTGNTVCLKEERIRIILFFDIISKM